MVFGAAACRPVGTAHGVLVIGCVTLLRSWNEDAALRQAARQVLGDIRAHFATFCVAAATLTAGAVLAIVALHVLTD